jgi:predicted branched-subunit amino acid permease
MRGRSTCNSRTIEPMTPTPGHIDAPRCSLAGLREGAGLTLPMVPGVVVFASGFGTLAAQKGLSLSEAMLMSGVVFAGAAQLVVMEAWTHSFTVGALLALALVTATVNLRYVLMAASLRPWFGQLPPWQGYGSMLLVVDANWIVAMRYRSGGGSDIGIFLGSSLILWVFFVAGTAPGYLVGALVADPKRFGLDLLLPIFFAAMLVPMWRGPRTALPWIVAGGCALVVAHLLPGWWFIVGGAIAGSIAGGFVDERR